MFDQLGWTLSDRRVRHVVALSLLFRLVLHGPCIAADAQSNAAQSSPVTAGLATDVRQPDQGLMERMRVEIESIPEVDRERVGVEVLRARLSEFKSPVTKQRVLLSIGDLYGVLKENEESRSFYEQAVNANADPSLTLAARRRLAAVLTSLGRFEEAGAVLDDAALRQGKQFLPEPADERAFSESYLIETQRIHTRILAGDYEAALSAAVALRDMYPNKKKRTLRLAEQIGSRLQNTGRGKDAVDFYRRLPETFPDASSDPNIQSNYIAILRLNKLEDDAVAATREFVQRFPDHEFVPAFCSVLAESALENGRSDEGLRYLNLMESHPRSDAKLRAIARRSIDETLGESPDGRSQLGRQSAGSWQVLFLVLNAAVVAVLGMIFAFRQMRVRES